MKTNLKIGYPILLCGAVLILIFFQDFLLLAFNIPGFQEINILGSWIFQIGLIMVLISLRFLLKDLKLMGYTYLSLGVVLFTLGFLIGKNLFVILSFQVEFSNIMIFPLLVIGTDSFFYGLMELIKENHKGKLILGIITLIIAILFLIIGIVNVYFIYFYSLSDISIPYLILSLAIAVAIMQGYLLFGIVLSILGGIVLKIA